MFLGNEVRAAAGFAHRRVISQYRMTAFGNTRQGVDLVVHGLGGLVVVWCQGPDGLEFF